MQIPPPLPPVAVHEGHIPTTCAVGQLLYDLDAPAGQGIYVCSEPNVWTVQLGSMTVGSRSERPQEIPSHQPSAGEIGVFLLIFTWLALLTIAMIARGTKGRDAD